ncbi:MAG: glycosyltransferase family 4 protein [Chloroflexi bacterium]|nr:glycosyltransferase family 4 protein [Chloroflexota bacterium]
MPRITIDVTPAVHQSAGIGRLTREIVRHLLQIESRSQYRLFCMGRVDSAGSATLAAIQPHPPRVTVPVVIGPLNDRWMYRIWYRARLPVPVQLLAGACDLYHATDFVLPPVLPGTRTVLTVHDLTFERDPGSAPPTLLGFLKRVVPQSVRRATHIVADSYATARDLTELYAVAAEKITTIHSGVDERFTPRTTASYYKARSSALRAKYGLPAEPFILTVGTLQRRKNHLTLVRAMARLNDRLRTGDSGSESRPVGVKLVIAGGKGWLYDEVQEEIGKLGIEAQVVFAGFVDDADLPDLYHAAAVFAFPSLYEGFGIPPLEAMACGIPVVTSNASSLPEVVGDAGLMVDPLDVDGLSSALYRALFDEVWRTQAVSAGMQRAATFTWQRAAQQLLAVYDKVLADAGQVR